MASAWTHAAISQIAGRPILAAGDPHGYFTPADQTARVVFRGADSHIHELWLQPGTSWTYAPLSQIAGSPTAAAGDPHGYFTPADQTARVVFRGADGHIHELWFQPRTKWTHAPLDQIAASPTPSVGDPHGYFTPSDGTARVVCRTALLGWTIDLHVRELWHRAGNPWTRAELDEIAIYLTRFRPAKHGFHFGNDFPNKTLPPSVAACRMQLFMQQQRLGRVSTREAIRPVLRDF